jgi:hypothetical protein
LPRMQQQQQQQQPCLSSKTRSSEIGSGGICASLVARIQLLGSAAAPNVECMHIRVALPHLDVIRWYSYPCDC